MKILLVGNYEADKQESMQRYVAVLESGLIGRGFDVRIVKPKSILGQLAAGSSAIRKWLGYIDKFLLFRSEFNRNVAWADLVHICDHSNAIYSTWVKGVPLVVTCHDLLAIRSALGELGETHTGWTGRLYQRLIRKGLERSPVIVSVSESTRNDVSRIIGAHGQLYVVHNGLNYPYSPMGSAEADAYLGSIGVAHGYLLHVGGNHWYKNRMGVLRIFDDLVNNVGVSDISLVMAGENSTPEMDVFIEQKGLGGKIKIVTGVSNEVLRALYTRSDGLLFPSLYEGFGWPIAEAHACGCPVFTTDKPPMTEVGGECAVYIDPGKVHDAAQKIAASLLSGEGGGDIALRNAARFSSSKMIDDYISLYQRVSALYGKR